MQIWYSYQRVSLKTYDEIRLENQIEIPEHISKIVESVFTNLTKSSQNTGLITNLKYVDNKDAHAAQETNSGSQDTYLLSKQAEVNLKAYDQLLNYKGQEDLSFYIENVKIPQKFCPRIDIKCDPYYPYRTLDGSCNNLEYSWWGKAEIPYRRFLPPDYDDRVGAPRKHGKDGYPLMNERAISIKLVPSFETESEWTIFFLFMGQFIGHDLTEFAVVTNADGSRKVCACGTMDKDCKNVDTPFGDFVNRDQRCMSLARSKPAKNFECRLGARDQVNLASSFLDLGPLYGNDEKTGAEVRQFEYGLLKTSYTPYSNLEELPKRDGSKCPFAERSERCFKAADPRAEDNVMLLSVHALWLREHNRVARKLAYINPNWDDETIYQEARRITIAEYQHIVVHEYLPVFIGEKLSRDFDILPLREGYSSDYETKAQANTINEFANAAVRIAHTLVVDEHKRADKYHRLYDLKNISDYQFNSVKYAIDAPLEDILYGSLNEASYIKACQMNKEMNHHLFESVLSNEHTKRWSLVTRNIMRGRDNGFPGYNFYREKCGLSRAKNFDDLSTNIPEFLIKRLKKLYNHVDDIDLYVGLISEEPLKGAVAGFTSACKIKKKIFSKLSFLF